MPPTLACTLLFLYALVMTFLCFAVNYFRQQHLARIDLQSSRIDALDRECVRLEQAAAATDQNIIRLVNEKNILSLLLQRDPNRGLLYIDLNRLDHKDENLMLFTNTLKSRAPVCPIP